MVTEIWVNISSGNVRSNDIHLIVISQDIPQTSITEFSLKIAYVTFQSNLPGDNELIWSMFYFCNCSDVWDVMLWMIFWAVLKDFANL